MTSDDAAASDDPQISSPPNEPKSHENDSPEKSVTALFDQLQEDLEEYLEKQLPQNVR